MANLRRPSATFSFSDHQRLQPSSPPPGNELDGAFHDMREALLSTQEALAELRRDDGQLRNELVGPEQLKPALITNITGDVKKITDLLTSAVRNAISTHTITANDISLLAKDAEAAAMAARTWLSQAETIATRLQALGDQVEVRSIGVDTTATDAQNWANYAQAQADNAALSEDHALAWAEKLDGPCVSGPDAPAFIAQSPYPHGLFYNPVQGTMAAGLWSAKWWAIYAQQLVGWTSFFYLGAWDFPPAPGAINPDTGRMVPDPLEPGSFYFDEVDNTIKVWTGEAWVTPFSLTGGVTSSYAYKATAGQTVFTGADLFGKTPIVDPDTGHDVHVNGVKLTRDDGTNKGDYTVDHGTDRLTLLAGVTANSIVQWDLLVAPDKLRPGATTVYKITSLVPDGTKTVFTLSYAGPGGATAPVINKPAELMVVIDGANQEPVVDFNAAGATLTMAAAPAATSRMWAVWFKPGPP